MGVYTYIHIMEQYSASKGEGILTCYNMDEPWELYASWNKLVTKRQILYMIPLKWST